MSYKNFCGLAQATNIPDRTTVWTFESRIGEVGAQAIFAGVSTQLLKKGFLARGGEIIDKLSVNVDRKYEFLRKIVTDTASTHDSQYFEAVLDTANPSRDAYAERGYPSEEREAWPQEHGYRNRIQRKGNRNQPLSAVQRRRNQRIATTRARVEQAFAAIEQRGGKLIRTLGQARASFALTMMAACHNLKRLAYFQRAQITAL